MSIQFGEIQVRDSPQLRSHISSQKEYLHADGSAHVKHTLSFTPNDIYPALSRAKLCRDYLSLMSCTGISTLAERVPIQCKAAKRRNQ